MTHVVDPPPCCVSQEIAVPPKSVDGQLHCMPTRRDATHCRRKQSIRHTADENRRFDALPTQCLRRPSIRYADATLCRHDPVPTRTVADRCDVLPSKKLINADPSKSTRGNADAVTRSPRCHTVDESSSHTRNFTPQFTDWFETSRTSYEQIL